MRRRGLAPDLRERERAGTHPPMHAGGVSASPIGPAADRGDLDADRTRMAPDRTRPRRPADPPPRRRVAAPGSRPRRVRRAEPVRGRHGPGRTARRPGHRTTRHRLRRAVAGRRILPITARRADGLTGNPAHQAPTLNTPQPQRLPRPGSPTVLSRPARSPTGRRRHDRPPYPVPRADRFSAVSSASRSVAERLAAGARTGSVVSFSSAVPLPVDGENCGSVDVDAAVLRDLLRGTTSTDLDPRGVRLCGARVRGRLDLDQVDAVCPLVLEECLIEDGISAVGAHLRALTVARCRVEHPTQPALDATGLRVDGPLVLAGSTLRANAAAGTVVLVGARIGGDLDCRSTVLANTAGSAISADRAQIDNNVLFEDGVNAEGVGERGTLRLTGARIGGRLGLGDANLKNPSGPALSAVDLRTFHGLFLEGRFRAEGEGRRGTIYVRVRTWAVSSTAAGRGWSTRAGLPCSPTDSGSTESCSSTTDSRPRAQVGAVPCGCSAARSRVG